MNRRTVLFLAAAFIAAFVQIGQGQSGEQGIPPLGGRAEYVTDLAARRAKAAEVFGRESVLVLWSAPPRVYSDDTNYEFRQESNILYLTGLSRENVVFVLVPGSTGAKEFLFVPASDGQQELWTGHIPTVDEVRARTGVQQVFAQRQSEAFDAFMAGLFAATGSAAAGSGELAALGAAAAPAGSGSLQVALLDFAPIPASDAVETKRQGEWVRLQRERTGFRPLTFADASSRLQTMRQIKTPYEQKVLRRSVEISAEAHIEGMKATRPGRWEYEVEAAIEYWFLKNGAMTPGYPSIVGSGPNATTLHYLESSRQMQAGDLLLVDAAGNYQGLTGDITRTYPVSRQFTTAQRALYELVLAAQESGIAAARPGARAADINRAIRQTFGVGLLQLGLIADPAAKTGESPEIGLWFPHSAVHGIGVDVHDPLGRLDPGAAFVIEPGLYIRQDTFDRLEQDPSRAALVRTIRPAFERYRNAGIRIEDSFLMTAAGPENLSSKAPRRVDDIERFVGTGRD